MDIRCTNCQHIGPAADVRPTPTGAELICANCGHANPLSVGENAREGVISDPGLLAEDAPDPTPPPKKAPSVLGGQGIDLVAARAFAERERQAAAPPPKEEFITKKTLERLVPEPGEGERCRKCANLVTLSDSNCQRCGLNIADSHRYGPGEAPWEVAPRGKEGAFEQARLLWGAFQESPSEEGLSNYIDFVRDEGFYEMGIRRLRFHLVDHPDDQAALAHLQELASKLQRRVIAARAQAEVSAQQFEEDVARTKSALIVAVLFFWGGIFLLFLLLFMDTCR